MLLSLGATQSLRSVLYGVAPTDLPALGGVTALFFAVSELACWLPSRRAALVDPVTAIQVA